MFKESGFRPNTGDITRYLQKVTAKTTSVRECVGISIEVDEQGYARRIVQSDSSIYPVDSLDDALKWLRTADYRLLFASHKGWADPILKWFGQGLLPGFRALDEGYPIRVGTCRIWYDGSMTLKVRDGVHRVKRVFCLQPNYHMSSMLPDEVDAQTVAYLGERLVKSLDKASIDFDSLQSPGSVLKNYLGLRRDVTGVGVGVNNLPKEVMDAALASYHTPWVSAYGLGTFKKAANYDIISAFPSEVEQLFSCSPAFGLWKQSSIIPDGACYGFAQCEIVIDSEFSPLLQRTSNSYIFGHPRSTHLANRIGWWQGFLTLDEINFIKQYDLGYVKVLSGWWFLPKRELLPYDHAMQWLFNARSKARKIGDSVMANYAKLLGVSAQGCFISTYPDYGGLIAGLFYNPVYAAVVTSRVRLKVAEFCLRHSGHILAVMVDGVVTDKVVEGDSSDSPGAMRLSSHSDGEECVIASEAHQWLSSRSSVFDPGVLSRYAGEDYFEMQRVGLNSLALAAEGQVSFALVGTKKMFRAKTTLDNIIKRSSNEFADVPKTCHDLLTYNYHSEGSKVL